MAARKKVTKKASSPATKSAASRTSQRDKRAPGQNKTSGAAARAAKAEKAKEKLKSVKTAGASKAKAQTSASQRKAKPLAAAAKSRAAGGKTRAPASKVEKARADKSPAKKLAKPVEASKPEVKFVEPKLAPAETTTIELASKRPEAVSAPVLGGTAPKPTAPTAPVVVARPAVVEPAKAVKALAPTKSVDRDLPGGEQKTMKSNANKHGFKLNEFVVYPAHGVGQIVAMEEQEVAGFRLELFVINFVKDKMTLRVPTSKVAGVGMRKLSDANAAQRSLDILTGRARIKRTMWSRRAQEYEAKINSGDINAIAEVVRDLYRSEAQPEQSYSERQLYEAALDRMMREIAAVQKISETETLKLIETQLKKNQRRAGKPEGEGEEASIEEAA